MTLIAYAKNLLHRVEEDQDGASLVEYALLISLIAAVAFIAIRAGLGFWRHRHPDDGDTGCLVA